LGRIGPLPLAWSCDRLRRNLAVWLGIGEGPLTGSLRTHSSRIENWYFVEFTATPGQAA
jgi:hypothetical protein